MHINVITTWKCNFKCKHCIFECPKDEELDFEKYKKVIKKFLPYDLHTLTFTGGEPILHPRIGEMVEFASKNNIYFDIISNAFWYEKYLPIVKKNRKFFRRFCFSLDGLEKTHDFERRKGSFKRVIEAVHFYKKLGIDININFVLNNKNYEEVEEFIAFCKSIEIKRIKLGGIIPTKSNGELQISFDKIKKVYSMIPFLVKKYNISIDVPNSLYNPVKLEFCPVVTNIRFTLNQRGEILFCCDIPGSKSIIGLPIDNVEKLIKKRIEMSNEIRYERMKKIKKSKLKDVDQTCYYCHRWFGLD
jgi:MoaA/NifB/PqqE/SkfB family radical SAM enzyme